MINTCVPFTYCKVTINLIRLSVSYWTRNCLTKWGLYCKRLTFLSHFFTQLDVNVSDRSLPIRMVTFLLSISGRSTPIRCGHFLVSFFVANSFVVTGKLLVVNTWSIWKFALPVNDSTMFNCTSRPDFFPSWLTVATTKSVWTLFMPESCTKLPRYKVICLLLLGLLTFTGTTFFFFFFFLKFFYFFLILK